MRFFFILMIFLSSCGTTGHVVFYNFEANKYDVEAGIQNLIARDTNYALPTKWEKHTKGDYFERIYIYFKNSPEELYQVGFTYDSAVWKTSTTSRLGLIAIFKGDQFQYESDLDYKEIKRIQLRFESEILSKIQIPYYKSN